MTGLKLVTYCGLYCGLCGQGRRIPRRAAVLRDAMSREGWDQWSRDGPGFAAFWEFLGGLVAHESVCSCRGRTCGNPHCVIRDCAQGRGVDACPFCSDYPCHHLEALAERYPNLLTDGRRLARLGLQRWIAEQKQRQNTGFAYADIRHEVESDTRANPGPPPQPETHADH